MKKITKGGANMKKTYITEMPNRVGAFLQASRIFAALDINITRVSYNKAVDSHMLFIDVSGDKEQIAKADEELERIGYLQQNADGPRIILIEFKLQDVPGTVTGILELIEKHQLNISYMSSQENDTDYQLFKMGLFVEDESRIDAFIHEAQDLCMLRELLPGFDGMEKSIVISHADVDHCGLLPLFDNVYLSRKSAESLTCEYAGEDGLRERNPLHRPYIKICKILTKYKPVDPRKLVPLWDDCVSNDETDCEIGCVSDDLFAEVGRLPFGSLSFAVYEGAGGHLPGEIILADVRNKITFCGDIFVNLKDMIPEQKKYNRYAPILMTSVDTDPALCKREREELFKMFGENGWRIFPSHGAVKTV